MVNTPNKMDSKKKNAIIYSFAKYFKDLFQQSIIQVGNRKAVNWIIIKASPSIPKIRLTLIDSNQEYFSKNWNVETVGSKKKRKLKQILRIIRDQNNEKLRIKAIFVLSIKERKTAANKGNSIKFNNII